MEDSLEEAKIISVPTAANSSSRLLSLPQEIKHHIYKLALGDQTIHISGYKYWDTRSLHTTICLSHLSSYDAQAIFDKGQGGQWNAPTDMLIHKDCYKGCYPSNKSLSLGLLRTCRQVYHEAKYVPFSTNTFSFDVKYDLLRFLRFLEETQPRQILFLRSIHLHMKWYHGDMVESWNRDALPRIASTLVNLRHIHVHIESRLMYDFGVYSETAKAMQKLSVLPLDNVAVTIYDDCFEDGPDVIPHYGDIWLLSLSEKREWVRQVRTEVLAKCG